MKSFFGAWRAQCTSESATCDEGVDGTQHALIEGKVHIPRSPALFARSQTTSAKINPPLLVHHPLGTGPFLFLKVGSLTPTYINQLAGIIKRYVGLWVTRRPDQQGTQLRVLAEDMETWTLAVWALG